LFWRKGYDATSVSDLTDAIGVNRPSLYAAFGNKEQLFRRVVERYTDGPACFDDALGETTARGVAEALLAAAIELNAGRGRPAGCLVVRSIMGSGVDEPVRRDVVASRTRLEGRLRRRFRRAISDGDLPVDADAAALAEYLCTLVSGISVQAAMGARPRTLHRFADRAMIAWPS
jgi:AcrR family transcriptional regulator